MLGLLKAGRIGRGRLGAAALQRPQAFSSSALAAQEEGDVVLDVFREQQKTYRDLLEGMKKIPVPLSLEAGAVKKYASDMESLKRKVGVPEMETLFSATLNHHLRLSGGSLRKFLTSAVEGVDLGDQSEAVTKLFAALDRVEADSGPLNGDNEAGVAAFEKEVQAIAKEHKVDDLQAIKPKAILDMYTSQLQHLRTAAEEEIDLAKRRDNLEGMQIDVTSIKPEFA